jgi:hypothetical protein
MERLPLFVCGAMGPWRASCVRLDAGEDATRLGKEDTICAEIRT